MFNKTFDSLILTHLFYLNSHSALINLVWTFILIIILQFQYHILLDVVKHSLYSVSYKFD
jgi:hypothetical protein